MKARAIVHLALALAGVPVCATGSEVRAPTIAAASTTDGVQARSTPPRPINVIFLLADGASPEAWPLARWVKGGPLAVDGILSGAVRTYGADSVVTDSAPGATAYATGFKGSDKGISVGAWNVTIDAARPATAPPYVPVATLLEGAKLSGRAVGLVATSNVQHATPAAFSAHWPDRDDYAEIAEQQVHQAIDVVLSGGRQFLLPKGVPGGRREDSLNLVEVLKSRGYAVIGTRDELTKVAPGRVWGAFADDAMAFDIDRQRLARTEPSLAEMTGRAIDLLAASAKGRSQGFFLFVEGSQVDWGAHDNDPAAVVSEVRAFDDAVKVALDFAKGDGDTLVIVVSDHGTGGLTIGTASDGNYTQTDDDSVVGPLRRAKLTARGVYQLHGKDLSEQALLKAFAEEWGMPNLACDDLAPLQHATDQRAFVKAAAPLLSRKARIGWTTGNHTGADVFLWSFGPGRPSGLWQNSDLGRFVAERMGFELGGLNQRLFVEAKSAFGAIGFSTALDRDDPLNPVLVVSKQGATARLPVSRNVLQMGGKVHELEGVVVLSEKLRSVFVPRQAIELVAAGL